MSTISEALADSEIVSDSAFNFGDESFSKNPFNDSWITISYSSASCNCAIRVFSGITIGVLVRFETRTVKEFLSHLIVP